MGIHTKIGLTMSVKNVFLQIVYDLKIHVYVRS
jgi:hypothetical protein